MRSLVNARTHTMSDAGWGRNPSRHLLLNHEGKASVATSHSSNGSTAEQEVHERQVHYFVVPVEISTLVEAKTISRAEAYLLAEIHSLVVYGGVGCWASNAYLAAKCGVTSRQIQYEMAKLLKLGLLVHSAKQARRNGEAKRTVEPAWARAVQRAITEGTPHERSFVPPTKGPSSPPRKVLRADIDNERERENSSVSPVVGGFLGTDRKDSPADKLAARLHKAIASRYIVVSTNRSAWSGIIRKLAAKHTIDTVTQVIEWYEANTAKFHLRSATGFATHFDKLLGMMARHQPTKAPASPELTDDERRLVKDVIADLSHLRWPKGSAAELPMAIAKSLKAYIPVRRKLNEIDKAERLTHKFGSLALCLLSEVCLAPRDFLAKWFGRVHRQIKGWDDWSGDFTQFVFRPDHKRFVADGYESASRYGAAHRWQKILEVISDAATAAK